MEPRVSCILGLSNHLKIIISLSTQPESSMDQDNMNGRGLSGESVCSGSLDALNPAKSRISLEEKELNGLIEVGSVTQISKRAKDGDEATAEATSV